MKTLETEKTTALLSPMQAAESMVRYLAPATIEVLEGARGVQQLGGLVNEDVYQLLHRKAVAIAKLRQQTGTKSYYPVIEVSRVHQECTTLGTIESIVLLKISNRTRAMTVRLEQHIDRWLATAITVL